MAAGYMTVVTQVPASEPIQSMQVEKSECTHEKRLTRSKRVSAHAH